MCVPGLNERSPASHLIAGRHSPWLGCSAGLTGEALREWVHGRLKSVLSGTPTKVLARLRPLLRTDLDVDDQYLLLLARMMAFDPTKRPSIDHCIKALNDLPALFSLPQQ